MKQTLKIAGLSLMVLLSACGSSTPQAQTPSSWDALGYNPAAYEPEMDGSLKVAADAPVGNWEQVKVQNRMACGSSSSWACYCAWYYGYRYEYGERPSLEERQEAAAECW